MSLLELFDDRLMMASAGLAAGMLLPYPAMVLRLPLRLFFLLEKKLNRIHRAEPELVRRGLIWLVMLLAGALLLGLAMQVMLGLWSQGQVVEIIILGLVMPLRRPYGLAVRTQRYLQKNQLVAAQNLWRMTTWRNAARLDEYGLRRAVLETMSAGLVEKIMVPCVWYVLLGLPGLLAACLLQAAQERLAWQPQQQAFGRWPRRVYRWLCAPVVRLGSVLLALAAFFLPGMQAKAALKQAMKAPLKQERPLATLPVLVMATALRVSLGGQVSMLTHHEWLGEGAARVMAKDLRRAQWLYAVSSLLWLMVLCAFAL